MKLTNRHRAGIVVLALIIVIGTLVLLWVNRKDTDGDEDKRTMGTGPRSVRNNNPGALLLTPDPKNDIPWKGKVPRSANTDGLMEQFTSYKWGTRAMLKLIVGYINSGYDSLATMLPRWSGTQGQNYIAFVESVAGIDRNRTIVPTITNLRKLSKAIAQYEAGVPALTEAEFMAGYKEAFP